MPSDLWGFFTLVVTGFTACAEFGSYAFVHPVIRRLPPEHHIRVEQGLLRTFGRWMPFAMTLCVVLSVNYAVMGSQGGADLIRIVAAALFAVALISTLIFNVPVNLATGRWDADARPLGILPGCPLLVAPGRLHRRRRGHYALTASISRCLMSVPGPSFSLRMAMMSFLSRPR